MKAKKRVFAKMLAFCMAASAVTVTLPAPVQVEASYIMRVNGLACGNIYKTENGKYVGTLAMLDDGKKVTVIADNNISFYNCKFSYKGTTAYAYLSPSDLKK